ncbi:long-chain fatty acid--CoA ligase [Francisella tularensis subsp. novicida]|uniref:Long-chain-fatty-acid--CoA ligase n=2 Tax=Francisella tularensis TaxID=263 RepID=A0A6I4RPI3_FRATU|nr:long-chain fatty acid--CoA ligase [Francisella tularensis]ABK90154.1 long chain fatty acid CoA ligase [Francisella tularensis subsp. novicida U112]AJI60671.1 AMP-binding enzyme family protein [Francisella tularensis subsp. novicida U112]APA83444.1 Long-chain-fatty-acid--CoA ligase [Francisella tularensis subsp. novicida PA10-7858]APC94919.1 AMP-binding enzyme family protein [Francisella tularensis subsp. novicida]EDX19678.1 long-chain-fatty-acid--CoA ligase [Francisella tularensis subsp. no
MSTFSNKTWIANYPDYTPENITENHATILDLYEKTIIQFPYREAVSCHDVNLTFIELDKLATKMASFLQNNLGINKGDRVAIVLPNCLQFTVSLFACVKVGAVFVNTNPLYTADEIEAIFNNCNVKAAIVMDMFAHHIQKARVNIDSLENVIVTNIADLYPFPKKQIIGFVSKYLIENKPKYTKSNFIAFSKVIKADISLYKKPVLTKQDILCLQYSSGTTGRPKGAILTHDNLASNIQQVWAWIKHDMDMSDQVIITALPLYHIFSLSANLLCFFFAGAKNVLIPNARDIKNLIKTMSKNEFTIFNGLNTLYMAMLEHPDFEKINKTRYLYSLSGGMPISRKIYLEWLDRTGVELKEGYGMTEMSPAIALNKFNESEDDYFGTCGYPIPSTELSIRDIHTHQEITECFKEGEIWLKGPQRCQGFWNDKENNELHFTADGWLKTGDIGYIDKKGRLTISDRIKNMIIVSGFNVYPREIELCILKLDYVREVAVTGVKSKTSGERPIAFISLEKGSNATEEDIIKHCKDKLASYKVPRSCIFVETLPKNNTGKIDIKKLKNQFL